MQNAAAQPTRVLSRLIPILTIVSIGMLVFVLYSRWQLPANPVAVTGVVRVNGVPLATGVINFRAADPNHGSYAMGLIGKDGRYTAESPYGGAGILPGKYLVGVLAQEDPTRYTPQEYDALVGPGKPGIPSIVPISLTDPATSGLSVTIVAPGPQTYDLSIEGPPDKPGNPNESGN